MAAGQRRPRGPAAHGKNSRKNKPQLPTVAAAPPPGRHHRHACRRLDATRTGERHAYRGPTPPTPSGDPAVTPGREPPTADVPASHPPARRNGQPRPIGRRSDVGQRRRRSQPPPHVSQPTRMARGPPRPLPAARRAPAPRRGRGRRWARTAARRTHRHTTAHGSPKPSPAQATLGRDDRITNQTQGGPSGWQCAAAAGCGKATDGATRLLARTAPLATTRQRGNRHTAEHQSSGSLLEFHPPLPAPSVVPTQPLPECNSTAASRRPAREVKQVPLPRTPSPAPSYQQNMCQARTAAVPQDITTAPPSPRQPIAHPAPPSLPSAVASPPGRRQATCNAAHQW